MSISICIDLRRPHVQAWAFKIESLKVTNFCKRGWGYRVDDICSAVTDATIGARFGCTRSTSIGWVSRAEV